MSINESTIDTALKANQSHAYAIYAEIEEHIIDERMKRINAIVPEQYREIIEKSLKDVFGEFDGIRNFMCSKQENESFDCFLNRTMMLDELYEEITGRKAYE